MNREKLQYVQKNDFFASFMLLIFRYLSLNKKPVVSPGARFARVVLRLWI